MATTETRILVVEDEAIIRKDIEMRLEALGYTIAGSARTGEEAEALAWDLRPDLVLMDIHLADGVTGIQAARAINRQLHIPVIFLTANSDEATIDLARTAEPFGFLVKPFTKAALGAAIEVAVFKSREERNLLDERAHLFDVVAQRGNSDHFFVKCDGLHVRVVLKEITHVEAMTDYVGIHTDGRRIVVHSTMGAMMERLPADRFMRVHRSFIVRIDRIGSIEGNTITLENGAGPIPISNSYQSEVRDKLGAR